MPDNAIAVSLARNKFRIMSPSGTLMDQLAFQECRPVNLSLNRNPVPSSSLRPKLFCRIRVQPREKERALATSVSPKERSRRNYYAGTRLELLSRRLSLVL